MVSLQPDHHRTLAITLILVVSPQMPAITGKLQAPAILMLMVRLVGALMIGVFFLVLTPAEDLGDA